MPKAKTPRRRNAVEDEAESQRFLETARQMQDAGELSRTEDGAAFDRLLGRAAPPKPRR